MKPVLLDNDCWSLSVLPEWGGRIGSLRAGNLDVLVPVESPTFDPLVWPKAGAYPLMPYSNRLRHARLSFDGIAYELPAHPAAEPHTLHGVSHTQAWQVEHSTSEQMTIACEYRGEHWPWPIRCEQHFRLDGNQLTIRMSLTNLGETLMPGGIGLHPYFLRRPGMRARFQAGSTRAIDSEYLAGDRCLLGDLPMTIDASDEKKQAHYLSEWDGLLKLDYPEGQLRLDAGQPLTHFVAFAPAGCPYLCLEPVSHLADAFNQAPSKWRDVGTQVLAPGACLAASITLSWMPR